MENELRPMLGFGVVVWSMLLACTCLVVNLTHPRPLMYRDDQGNERVCEFWGLVVPVVVATCGTVLLDVVLRRVL